MWQEEVDKKGIEKASLGKICLKFVRTRLVFMFTGLFMVTMSLLFVTVNLFSVRCFTLLVLHVFTLKILFVFEQ